ncbi:MAG: EAL domain-containing protein [Capsulimonadaceae bacterium]|nr:EAL domain-containing protein [Capsulimonadaceae bacterium]
MKITNLTTTLATKSILFAAIAVATVAAIFTIWLEDIAESYRHAEANLLQVRAMAFELRSLDKDGEAGPGFDYTIAERSDTLNVTMLDLMKQLDSPRLSRVNLRAVRRAYERYFSKLSEKYDDLEHNDRIRAISVGMVYVDPSFKDFTAALAGASKSYEMNATIASTSCEAGIVITLFISALFSVRLFKRYERARTAMLAAEQEAILRSEERFRSILRNSSDVVLIANRDNTVEYASPACRAQWGYDEDDIRMTSCLQFVHPDDTQHAKSIAQHALATPGENISSELRLQCATGDYRHHEVVVNNLCGDYGVRGVVWTFRNITERKAFEQKLSHQAFHDALTGLPNRSLFLDRLERALMLGRPVAVMFLDLDNFKLINDSLGHEAGDRLLMSVSERLRTCARRSDTVARLGGDEFTILVEHLANDDDPYEIAQRIADALREPTTIDGREVITTASVGIAVCNDGAIDPEGMLRDADTAMYHAKATGKARCAMFDASMSTRVTERLDLETDLRRALDHGEFEVYYQPIIRMQTGQIYEVEALIRWRHPERGLIPPIKFISIAEETGLIVPIGRWVLQEACRKARQWQRMHSRYLSINVNMSARQLQDDNLVSDVQAALAESGLPASSLKLEITESLMMTDRGADVQKLYSLKKLGIRLAIDDFGTGYSSMSYLSTLPIDTLKIDRAFVSRLSGHSDDDAIIKAIIGLAKMLDLEVISEGVETVTQHNLLTGLGCDRAQGYYYSRPLPADAMEEMLKAPADMPVSDPIARAQDRAA